MLETWIGVQDYADTAPKWLDATVSFSWLRAFECLPPGIRTIAYVREQHYTRDVQTPIRGVKYSFKSTPFPEWISELISIGPSVLMYNLCEYNIAAQALSFLKKKLPNTTHVIRLHHEVGYLLSHVGFTECLLSTDVAIVPSARQIEELRSVGYQGRIDWAPFGVDQVLMQEKKRAWIDRDLDVVSANTTAPQKNSALRDMVYKILENKGYQVSNIGGLTPVGLAEYLGRAKIFFQPSMTEATGSRVLLEGIAAGCYPIVLSESATATEVALEHGGEAITTGIYYDYKSKVISAPDGAAELIANRIELALTTRNLSQHSAAGLRPAYSETSEILKLIEILIRNRGSYNWKDAPECRAAKALLNALSISNERNAESAAALMNEAASAACDSQYVANAKPAAQAICRALNFEAAAFGLSQKLFTKQLDFKETVNWIHAESTKRR